MLLGSDGPYPRHGGKCNRFAPHTLVPCYAARGFAPAHQTPSVAPRSAPPIHPAREPGRHPASIGSSLNHQLRMESRFPRRSSRNPHRIASGRRADGHHGQEGERTAPKLRVETTRSCSVENLSRAACANWFAGASVLKPPVFSPASSEDSACHSTLGEVFNRATRSG